MKHLLLVTVMLTSSFAFATTSEKELVSDAKDAIVEQSILFKNAKSVQAKCAASSAILMLGSYAEYVFDSAEDDSSLLGLTRESAKEMREYAQSCYMGIAK